MSISVNNLTKLYGSQKAVDSISFEIPKGQIVGFLGPNGAGKSTTMKILTGYIPPSEGTASICGLSVLDQTIEAKRKVGYLPESNALYKDMYVKEFLNFVANIFQIENKTKRIAEMIEITGLGLEQHKKISQLSKGYKQRVGLAQALIHNPEVLILDEPTSGLDPNQLVEIRNLITEIGKEKTVLLSTHIMQEVEAMCQRVIIINLGKIVADNNTSAMRMRSTHQTVLEVEFKEKIDLNKLQKLAGVEKVEPKGPQFWLYSKSDSDIVRKSVMEFAYQNDLTLVSMMEVSKNLESVFKELTLSN